MTKILALDLATTTGWACGPAGGRVMSGAKRFGRVDSSRAAILHNALVWLHDMIKVERPEYLIYEAPLAVSTVIGSTRIDTTRIAFGLAGLTETVAYANSMFGDRVRSESVQTIRKYFIGKGNLKGHVAKGLVAQKCHALGWVDREGARDFDRCDALAVWAYGCHVIAPGQAQEVTPLFAGAAE